MTVYRVLELRSVLLQSRSASVRCNEHWVHDQRRSRHDCDSFAFRCRRRRRTTRHRDGVERCGCAAGRAGSAHRQEARPQTGRHAAAPDRPDPPPRLPRRVGGEAVGRLRDVLDGEQSPDEAQSRRSSDVPALRRHVTLHNGTICDDSARSRCTDAESSLMCEGDVLCRRIRSTPEALQWRSLPLTMRVVLRLSTVDSRRFCARRYWHAS